MAAREEWIAETRASTLRALVDEGVPTSAGVLEGNLDCSEYTTLSGFRGVRSAREIGAALQHLAKVGLAARLAESERHPDDPPGVLYEITHAGRRKVAKPPTSRGAI